MSRQSSREIDVQAADWAARADRGPLSVEDQAALDAWLSADDRRVGAYAKARGFALQGERARALGPGFDPEAFAARTAPEVRHSLGRSRRRWPLLGAAALAASLAGVVVVFLLRPAPGDLHETRLGEMRVVPLADGSVVTLNTDSQLRVRYARDVRELQLVRGEALFDVAKDPTRPFTVQAGGTRVRAVGTSFTVSRLADVPVQVLVREGVVEVNNAASGRSAAPVRAVANTRVVAVQSGQPVPIAAVQLHPAEIDRELSWREGRIAFKGDTLQQAAAQFARYSDIRIVIDDPALAGETITGLFQANDPVGFSRAIASSLEAQVQVGAGEVRLRR